MPSWKTTVLFLSSLILIALGFDGQRLQDDRESIQATKQLERAAKDEEPRPEEAGNRPLSIPAEEAPAADVPSIETLQDLYRTNRVEAIPIWINVLMQAGQQRSSFGSAPSMLALEALGEFGVLTQDFLATTVLNRDLPPPLRRRALAILKDQHYHRVPALLLQAGLP